MLSLYRLGLKVVILSIVIPLSILVFTYHTLTRHQKEDKDEYDNS